MLTVKIITPLAKLGGSRIAVTFFPSQRSSVFLRADALISYCEFPYKDHTMDKRSADEQTKRDTNETKPQPKYEYKALPERGWFRILLLEPFGEDRSRPVAFRLENHEVDEAPPYEALSYTWGNEEANSVVEIDGVTHLIRKNLHDALQALRQADKWRPLWADAVCINQSDEGERNHQVWQMSKIYTRAKRVNIWPHDGNTWLRDGFHQPTGCFMLLERMYNVLLDSRGGLFPRLGSSKLRADESLTQALWQSRLEKFTLEMRGLESTESDERKEKKTPADIHYVTLTCQEEYKAYYAPVFELLAGQEEILNPEPYSSFNSPNTYWHFLDSAIRLLRQPWWKRMWTLQESVLCQDAVVLFWQPEKSLPIQYLETLAYFVYFSVSFGVVDDQSVWPSWVSIPRDDSLRSVWGMSSLRQRIFREKGGSKPMAPQLTLLEAIEASRDRKASDPRDKIIGLLGLIGDRKQELGLVLEYGMTVEEVYRSAFAAALREQGDLDGFGLLSEMPKARNPGLPSWVPDFQLHSDTIGEHISSLSGLYPRGLYNASSVPRDSTRKKFIRTKSDDSILVLRGVLFDQVKLAGRKTPGLTKPRKLIWAAEMRRTASKWRSMMQDTLATTASNVNRSAYEFPVEAFWRTLLVDLKQHGVEGFPKRFAIQDDTLESLIYSRGDWRDRAPHRAWGASRLEEPDLAWVLSLDWSHDGGGDSNWDLFGAWWNASQGYLREGRRIEQINRRFFITECGRFGLGPPSLQPGDAICILLGGRVVYALRQRYVTGRIPALSEGWTYVGEWYVP